MEKTLKGTRKKSIHKTLEKLRDRIAMIAADAKEML
jgi:hypothetical protein